MKLQIADTHAHLNLEEFDEDRDEVITRAREAGVSTIITLGIDMATSKEAIELAEDNAGVLAGAGIHPHKTDGVSEADIAELSRLAKNPRVIAIGEAGLDFYRDLSEREGQIRVLKMQLELAVELNLPISLHCRQAEDELLAILREWTSRHKDGQARGVIHRFSGDTDTARQYLETGLYISLGAHIGYPSSRGMPDVIRTIPGDRLLLETDCPFLPPQSRRGQRNEPAYLPQTLELLAEIRQVPPETLARETTQNARRLFRIQAI